MGEFLDRIQSASPAGDRDRTLEAVRGIFYAMMQCDDEAGCREVAALLPEELETLWKPALFTCLREHRSPEGPPVDADFLDRARSRVSGMDRGDIERLTRAVIDGLAPLLSEEERDRLLRKTPSELMGDGAG